MSELLTPEEVADLLKVKVRWVYRASGRDQNPLPAIRVGKFLRYDKASVQQWIDGQKEAV